MIKIKQATFDDAVIIALLGRITFVESHSDFVKNEKAVKAFCNSEFNVAKIKDDLQNKNLLFWLVFYEDLPVGFAKVNLNKTHSILKSHKVCKLDKIYILNDFLGLKLGAKLHAEIINKIQELQFHFIWLVTYIYNYKAIKFYENHDYKKSGFEDFMVDGKGYKNHIMIKNLSE